MKPRLIVPVLAVLAAGGAGAWWFDLPARLGWGTDTADHRLALYGNVDIREVRLGFRVGGRLADALVDEGDRIAAGAVLARLDPRPYQDRVDMTQAQVAAKAAALAKLVAGPRPAEIAQAEAAHKERLADLDNARQNYDRVRQLRAGTTVSQATLDQAKAALDMAAARATSAREALRLLQEGTRPEDIATARADLQAAEANLAAARTDLADTTLRAPAAGTLLSRVREPGSVLGAGEAAYVLSVDEPVWVRVYVGETNLGRIHPGMAVNVTTDTAPNRPYRGQVGFISPVAEFTPKSVETPELRTDLVYRLRVRIDGADKALRQGMPVTVTLTEAQPASDAAS